MDGILQSKRINYATLSALSAADFELRVVFFRWSLRDHDINLSEKIPLDPINII